MSKIIEEAKKKATYLQEQQIKATSKLVESHRNYINKDIGINKPKDILSPLGHQGNRDPLLEARTAIYQRNLIERVHELYETGRSDLQWVDKMLALVAVATISDLSDLVISIQPLNSPSGTIFFMDLVNEKNKGNMPAGNRLNDALRGYYGGDNASSEEIKEEPVAPAGTQDILHDAEYLPIIPGSIEITDGQQTIRDDENGNLVGDIGTPDPTYTEKVTYIDGKLAFNFASPATGPVTISYTYNVEAATDLSRYGISFRSEKVEARPRAISAEFSIQASFDAKKQLGVDIEPTLLNAGANLINAEKFYHILSHLRKSAIGGRMTWSNRIPNIGVKYEDHIESFGIMLSRLQALIWSKTERVTPNVCVFGPDLFFLFQYTKGYSGLTSLNRDSMVGPIKVGELKLHGLTLICDPKYPKGQALVTYRGNEFVNTAAICGVYIPLYRSPIYQKFFKKEIAYLTEYCIYIVNRELIGNIEVTDL